MPTECYDFSKPAINPKPYVLLEFISIHMKFSHLPLAPCQILIFPIHCPELFLR